MDIAVDKYPVFKQNIYKHPHGGTILPKRARRKNCSHGTPGADVSTDLSWGTLNPFAAKILLECSGEKTIGEITSHLYQENAEKFKDSILTFFKNISLKFDIEFCDRPSPCNVKSCGTFECYYPLSVLAEVTTRCNLTCQHCSVPAGPDGVDMRKEDLFTIMKKLSDENIWSFSISGGEPFCRRDIFDIVEKCSDMFRLVLIVTNGTLIGKEEAKKIAEYENVIAQVSLDSHTPEFHDTFRGVAGAFEKAASGISTLVSEGVYTRVGLTVTRGNIETVEKILFFAHELGAMDVSYDMIRDVGRGKTLGVNPDEVMSWMKEVDTVREKCEDDISIVFERERREFSSQDCGAGKTLWILGPTGNVRPCTYLHEGYLVCGNLLTDEYDTVFNREPSTRFSSIKFPCEALCGECKYLLYCSGCFCNGVLMYKRLKDKCTWGAATEIGEWVTLD
jgi:radical SAM protein with 4Fe4S-binding SPASM domain